MTNPPDWMQQMLAAIKTVPANRPIVMINLLRFAAQANYHKDAPDTPCSGREAYARYSKSALPHVAGVGGELVWLGSVHAGLIQPTEEQWDEALLVRYPSIAAFVQMISNPEYQKITYHRAAALSDSRLLASEQSVSTRSSD